MESILVYFLKVNIALALFYIIYRFLFQNDTFFRLRRFTLLSIYLIAFLFPFLDISSWLSTQSGVNNVVGYYTTFFPENLIISPIETSTVPIWEIILQKMFIGLYLFGTCALLSRCIIELKTIFQTRAISPRKKINGIEVSLLKDEKEAYSFFNWIFIHPEICTTQAADEILKHEQTHVQQKHSIDVLIGELTCIFCWANPFVWLLKKEIVINQEYMADQEVVSAGYEKKTYQYHLIGVERPLPNMAAAKLYNNFNVLPLKKRITMLNKKRTNKSKRAKYVLLLPFAIGLLLISNIDAMARVVTEMVTLPLVAENKEKIYTNEECDVKPEFPDGEAELFKFINRNIKYPVIAQENGIQGTVIITFIIEKNGKIKDFKVSKGVDPSLDREALRVAEMLPNKWKPGKKDGKSVKVQYTLPIGFRLQ